MLSTSWNPPVRQMGCCVAASIFLGCCTQPAWLLYATYFSRLLSASSALAGIERIPGRVVHKLFYVGRQTMMLTHRSSCIIALQSVRRQTLESSDQRTNRISSSRIHDTGWTSPAHAKAHHARTAAVPRREAPKMTKSTSRHHCSCNTWPTRYLSCSLEAAPLAVYTASRSTRPSRRPNTL